MRQKTKIPHVVGGSKMATQATPPPPPQEAELSPKSAEFGGLTSFHHVAEVPEIPTGRQVCAKGRKKTPTVRQVCAKGVT
jgi:hypothetical protein